MYNNYMHVKWVAPPITAPLLGMSTFLLAFIPRYLKWYLEKLILIVFLFEPGATPQKLELKSSASFSEL